MKKRVQLSTDQLFSLRDIIQLHREAIATGVMKGAQVIEAVKREKGFDVTTANVDNVLKNLGVKPPFGFHTYGSRPAPQPTGMEQRLKAIEERLTVLEGKQPPPQFALAGG